MAEVTIENIIHKATDQFNNGDMLAARQSCLQALAKTLAIPKPFTFSVLLIIPAFAIPLRKCCFC